MDHLRNRVTLEINAKINDSPEFKSELYGGAVSAEPNSYDGKEIAVRRCENIFAVGDSVGMCRFTTKLFNSPSLPGYEEFADQVANVTGIDLTKTEIDAIGLNVMGVERLINTHCHSDHMGGNAAIASAYGCRITIPAGEVKHVRPWTPYIRNAVRASFQSSALSPKNARYAEAVRCLVMTTDACA